MAGPQWRHGNNAIVITETEGTGSAGCCDAKPGTGQVFTVVVTSHGPRHLKDATPFNHYSLLATVEHAFGLGCLQHACDTRHVVPMARLFGARSDGPESFPGSSTRRRREAARPARRPDGRGPCPARPAAAVAVVGAAHARYRDQRQRPVVGIRPLAVGHLGRRLAAAQRQCDHRPDARAALRRHARWTRVRTPKTWVTRPTRCTASRPCPTGRRGRPGSIPRPPGTPAGR